MIQCHNEVRDAFEDLSALKWNQVRRDLVINEVDLEKDIPTLRGDLANRGVWFPQSEVLFDIWIFDTDAQSYVNCSPKEILHAAEKEKKEKI